MYQPIIPIVYASDENFLWQTYISIFSVLANRKEIYKINFFILVPEGCIPKQYNEGWSFDDYSIEYRFVSSMYFRDVKMVLQNISKPTYYRLLIPMIFSEYDKCIYLDGDTLCCRDIYELYKIEMDNYLLAAGMGTNLPFNESYWANILELPNAVHYINAGVLLINLKQMRTENKVEEFLECSKRTLPCQDQDILNICCYGRIKILPLKYNIYSNAFNMPMELLLSRFTKTEIREALSSPAIIHYPGEFAKPWNNLYCVKGDWWWNYAERVFNDDIICEKRKKAIERMERYNYHILFKKIEYSSKVVIFGFSEVGQRFCDEVNEKYPEKIVCFCDNSKEKSTQTYRGYKVEQLDTIKMQYPSALIVITSQNYSDEIEKQLLKEKFDSANIAIYRKKTWNYIYSIDKLYWEEMKREIILDTASWNECFGATTVL